MTNPPVIDEAALDRAVWIYNDREIGLIHRGALKDAIEAYLIATLRDPASEQPEQVAQCPIKEAQDALVNLKPELQRSKLDEWKACYAALFNTLNPVVMENKRLKDQLARDGREVDLYIDYAGNLLAAVALIKKECKPRQINLLAAIKCIEKASAGFGEFLSKHLPTAAGASDDAALRATIKDIIMGWKPGENLHETAVAVIDAVRRSNAAAGAEQ